MSLTRLFCSTHNLCSSVTNATPNKRVFSEEKRNIKTAVGAGIGGNFSELTKEDIAAAEKQQ